jgi:hypothetical protein
MTKIGITRMLQFIFLILSIFFVFESRILLARLTVFLSIFLTYALPYSYRNGFKSKNKGLFFSVGVENAIYLILTISTIILIFILELVFK